MTLVECRVALSALAAALAEAARGAGLVAAVTGGPASGKSELLARFADLAADGGALLLTASGSRGERTIPLGAVGQLATGLPPVGASGFYGFVDRVLAAATTTTVVLAIDDVHHVDGASLRVLAVLRARAVDRAVLIALTECEPLAGGELTATADHRVRLGPLSEAGVAELLVGDLGPWAVTLAPACHRITGGNPLLVRALAADNHALVATATEPVVGLGYRQAVLGCLHRCEPRLLEFAKALAVLGGRPAPDLLAELTGTSRATVARMTGVLTAAGLVVDGEFSHSAMLDAVRDSLADGESARLNLRAAELLHRRRAAPCEIAGRLLAADRVAGAWSVEALRAAATEAVHRGHGEFAVRCLDLALPAATGAERDELVAARARAGWRFAPSGRACPGDADPVTSVRYALWHADPVEVPRLLAAARAVDPVAGGTLTLADEWIRGLRAPREPEPPDPVGPWERAGAALTPALLRGDLDEAARDAERLLQGCPLDDHTVEVLASALTALLHADRVERAEHWCGELLRLAESGRANAWLALFGSVAAEVALRRGAMHEARKLAEESLNRLPALSWGVLIGLPLSTMLLADTALGVHDSAALRVVVPDAMHDTVPGVRYLRARGHHYLATDRLLAAVADFQACGRFLTRNGVDLPALAAWRTDLAEASIRLGRRRVAAHLARKQLALPAAASRHTRGQSLRLLAYAGDRRHGPALLHEAAEEFRASGDRFAVALVLAELSKRLTGAGEHARARRVARTAADEARACGVVDLVDRVLRQRSGADPAEADPAEGLSDAEQRVAALAALGHTNREIATKLYVTVSTVEQHLTKIYRKLGVTRRADLPACLNAYTERTRRTGA